MTGSKHTSNAHHDFMKKASSHQDHSHREKPKAESEHRFPSSAQVNRVQTNKILELQMEALAGRLGDQPAQSGEAERLRNQLREKNAELQKAQQKISELRRQLQSMEEKLRGPPKKAVQAQNPVRKDTGHGQPGPKKWKQPPAEQTGPRPAPAGTQRPHPRRH